MMCVGAVHEAQVCWAELGDESPLDEDARVGRARSVEAADRRVESLRVLDGARHVLRESGLLRGPRSDGRHDDRSVEQVLAQSGVDVLRRTADPMMLHRPHLVDQQLVARMRRRGLVVGEPFDVTAIDEHGRVAFEAAQPRRRSG